MSEQHPSLFVGTQHPIHELRDDPPPLPSAEELTLQREQGKDRERRIDAFFERRELHAQAVVRFFRRMEQTYVDPQKWTEDDSTTTKRKTFHDQLEPVLSGVSRETRRSFEVAWSMWVDRVRRARRVYEEIAQDSGLDLQTALPSALGSAYYEQRVGSKPIGEVRLYVKGPFFVFSCSLSNEYGELKKALTAFEYKGEVGCSSRGVQYGKDEIPTLFSTELEISKSLLAHEEQHGLNRQLHADNYRSAFTGWEQVTTTRATERFHDSCRMVKDELTAYIRDGERTPARIQKTLSGELYSYHYDNLSEADAKRVKELLAKTVIALERHPWVYIQLQGDDREQARELLVASLLDIPLEQIPRYLELSAEVYERRLSGLEPPPVPVPPGDPQRAEYERQQDEHAHRVLRLLGLMPEYASPGYVEQEALAAARGEVPPPLPPSPNAARDEVAEYEEAERKFREQVQRGETLLARDQKRLHII